MFKQLSDPLRNVATDCDPEVETDGDGDDLILDNASLKPLSNPPISHKLQNAIRYARSIN